MVSVQQGQGTHPSAESRLSGTYCIVAKAIAEADLPMGVQAKLIDRLCKDLKNHDPRFDPEKFTVAAWGESW